MRTARVEVPQMAMRGVGRDDFVRLVELIGAVPSCSAHQAPDHDVTVYEMTAEHDDDQAVKVCGTALAALARGELHRYFHLVDTDAALHERPL